MPQIMSSSSPNRPTPAELEKLDRTKASACLAGRLTVALAMGLSGSCQMERSPEGTDPYEKSLWRMQAWVHPKWSEFQAGVLTRPVEFPVEIDLVVWLCETVVNFHNFDNASQAIQQALQRERDDLIEELVTDLQHDALSNDPIDHDCLINMQAKGFDFDDHQAVRASIERVLSLLAQHQKFFEWAMADLLAASQDKDDVPVITDGMAEEAFKRLANR